MKKVILLTTLLALLLSALTGCAGGSGKVKLDPKKPVTISVWHYYNGATMNLFDELVDEFNETEGEEKGIIVEAFGMGTVQSLETAVMDAANKKVGSQDMPDIFASYADTAYAAEQLGILANLGDYFTEEEQAKYLQNYIEEGKIGLNGELRIFPIAKSTEIFMLNDTDWQPFAIANDLAYDDIKTKEDIARVAKMYYEWTDSLTPDIENDGKAFFGRDGMANLMLIGSKELGVELFKVENGKVEINADKDVMKRIWDFYYVPYISGYYAANGRYRSDDTKVGDIISYVGSTSSSAYFPSEVTVDGKTYPITAEIRPVPAFEGASKVMVQQGAGMVVAKSTPEQEYASALFLKWFTSIDPNIRFSAQTAYLPVQTEANDFETFSAAVRDNGISMDDITVKTLEITFASISGGEMYTNKAFTGGANARAIIENSLPDKAAEDRQAVLELIESGKTHEEAVAQFNTGQNFESWYNQLAADLASIAAAQ